ncbi:hypothetical protein ADUPG1_006175 [Aduncisulcus paluster]|uniref:Uncharacterized protein n=1 Tax=Aduncisulcus paluster TaxID=2918883 RepID=A0ABQ5KIU4_9EUKA|nr:hypothetical protein ADUPG1_006175 [Aduncisulcus paluster]
MFLFLFYKIAHHPSLLPLPSFSLHSFTKSTFTGLLGSSIMALLCSSPLFFVWWVIQAISISSIETEIFTTKADNSAIDSDKTSNFMGSSKVISSKAPFVSPPNTVLYHNHQNMSLSSTKTPQSMQDIDKTRSSMPFKISLSPSFNASSPDVIPSSSSSSSSTSSSSSSSTQLEQCDQGSKVIKQQASNEEQAILSASLSPCKFQVSSQSSQKSINIPDITAHQHDQSMSQLSATAGVEQEDVTGICEVSSSVDLDQEESDEHSSSPSSSSSSSIFEQIDISTPIQAKVTDDVQYMESRERTEGREEREEREESLQRTMDVLDGVTESIHDLSVHGDGATKLHDTLTTNLSLMREGRRMVATVGELEDDLKRKLLYKSQTESQALDKKHDKQDGMMLGLESSVSQDVDINRTSGLSEEKEGSRQAQSKEEDKDSKSKPSKPVHPHPRCLYLKSTPSSLQNSISSTLCVLMLRDRTNSDTASICLWPEPHSSSSSSSSSQGSINSTKEIPPQSVSPNTISELSVRRLVGEWVCEQCMGTYGYLIGNKLSQNTQKVTLSSTESKGIMNPSLSGSKSGSTISYSHELQKKKRTTNPWLPSPLKEKKKRINPHDIQLFTPSSSFHYRKMNRQLSTGSVISDGYNRSNPRSSSSSSSSLKIPTSPGMSPALTLSHLSTKADKDKSLKTTDSHGSPSHESPSTSVAASSQPQLSPISRPFHHTLEEEEDLIMGTSLSHSNLKIDRLSHSRTQPKLDKGRAMHGEGAESYRGSLKTLREREESYHQHDQHLQYHDSSESFVLPVSPSMPSIMRSGSTSRRAPVQGRSTMKRSQTSTALGFIGRDFRTPKVHSTLVPTSSLLNSIPIVSSSSSSSSSSLSSSSSSSSSSSLSTAIKSSSYATSHSLQVPPILRSIEASITDKKAFSTISRLLTSLTSSLTSHLQLFLAHSPSHSFCVCMWTKRGLKLDGEALMSFLREGIVCGEKVYKKQRSSITKGIHEKQILQQSTLTSSYSTPQLLRKQPSHKNPLAMSRHDVYASAVGLNPSPSLSVGDSHISSSPLVVHNSIVYPPLALLQRQLELIGKRWVCLQRGIDAIKSELWLKTASGICIWRDAIAFQFHQKSHQKVNKGQEPRQKYTRQTDIKRSLSSTSSVVTQHKSSRPPRETHHSMPRPLDSGVQQGPGDGTSSIGTPRNVSGRVILASDLFNASTVSRKAEKKAREDEMRRRAIGNKRIRDSVLSMHELTVKALGKDK